VKLDIRQIPEEGLTLSEDFNPRDLDLDTDLIKFLTPVRVIARVTKSYGAVRVFLNLSAEMQVSCARCLKESKKLLEKKIELDFAVDKSNFIIEIDHEIREEIILSYPVSPLCNIDCKGLCQKCGKNLNEGGCNCGTT